MLPSTNGIVKVAHLTLIAATRIGIKYPNGTFKSERHFIDFVVNGQPLGDTESIGQTCCRG
jgi:hypothetical protein